MTWQETLESDEWRQAMTAAERTSDSRVEMIDTFGDWVTDVPADAAQVTLDGESAEMWGCQIRVVGQMIPLSSEDPLDPRANLRIRVWWRELLPSGWAEILMCTLYPSDPDIDDPGIPEVVLVGRDALSEAKRGGYRGQTIKVGGWTVTRALERLFAIVAPGIPVQVADSDETLPAKYTLGGRSPDEDWTELAAMADFSVWSDREGVIQVGPATEPSNPVASWQYGPGCAITRAGREMRTSEMRNRVVVVSTHPKVKKPIIATAEDTDEGSPTWIGYGRIWEEKVESDAITTATAAAKMARKELGKRLLPLDVAKVTIPGRPDLDFGDLCEISHAKAGLAGEYRVASWALNMPQRAASPDSMTVTMKARPRVESDD